MIIDEPEATNMQRISRAADAVERGQVAHVWIDLRMPKHSYVNWVAACLRARGHSNEAAEIMAGGVEIHENRS